MSEDNPGPAWRKATPFEIEAARRFTLHVEGLSETAIADVKADFSRSLCKALAAVVRELGRFPDDVEVTKIGVAVVEYYNKYVVPPLRTGFQ